MYIGKFCFVAGDSLEWPVEADQSISSDICNACWMSQPAWSNYHSQQYSDPYLSPEYCEIYDHCHHSTPANITCGIGYLDQVDSSSVSVQNIFQTPKLFLITNYPNPFNPITNINFYLSEDTYLDIIVYDIVGTHIKQISSKNQKSGFQSVQWNGTNTKGEAASAGVYFFSLETKNYRETKKMILLK